MSALELRGIAYRNEQDIQDISTEPAARLIIDYLSCLYGQREPKAWVRLMNQLAPFADDEVQLSIKRSFQSFFKEQKKNIMKSEHPSEWKDSMRSYLEFVGIDTLTALSPDYQSETRLSEVIKETAEHIEELFSLTSDLPLALARFSDDQAVRILTIHKSKGLEFDSTIIMAVDNEIFFGDQDANRCAFFVGVSRAKRRLVLTYAKERDRPANYHKRWNTSRTPQTEYLDYAAKFLHSK
jgi:superfamily I DNA/RNA helicase